MFIIVVVDVVREALRGKLLLHTAFCRDFYFGGNL